MAYVEAVQGKKYVPAAMAKTQRMRAMPEPTHLSRINLAIPPDARARWEKIRIKLHLPSLTATLLHVMGAEGDRLGIR